MVFDDTLLTDPERIATTDSAGVLRSLATAGAQVRSTREAAAEVGLAERVDVGRPRAVVLLARPGGGSSAMTLLAELLAPHVPAPVVVRSDVPQWVGPLDVVFAHSDDPGDTELATGLERAARHNATVVVSAADEGPIATAMAGRGVLVPARVPVSTGLSFPRALAAGLVTANALGFLVADVAALADQLDQEAERGHLSREPDSNPAKSLALRLAEHTPLLVGLDPLAVATARHAEHAFAAHAGIACHVTGYRQLQVRRSLYQAALSAADERNIFADPDDPDTVRNTFRMALLGLRGGHAAVTTRQYAERLFPAAQQLVWDGEQPSEEATSAAILALRCELAAAYVGLAAGTGGSVDPVDAGM